MIDPTEFVLSVVTLLAWGSVCAAFVLVMVSLFGGPKGRH